MDGQNNFLYPGGMFLISLLFAVMIQMIVNQEEDLGNLLENTALSFLGKKSYGIYLWHYPLIILGLL